MDGSLRQSKKKHDFESSTFQNKFLKENHQQQNWENLLTNHYRSLDAAFQYDLWCPAPKNISITHAAAAPSNLDAAITMRSPDTELQNTKELRATAWEIAAPKPDGSRHQTKKKTIHAAITMRFASRTLRENWAEYARNDPNRTRRTHEVPFHRRLQPLDTEKHKVLCSGFLPKTNPIQQSCSHHYNAFCGNTITTILPPQGVKNVTYIFGVPLCRVLWPWLYTTYIHIYVGCLIRSHKVNAQILHYIFRPGKQIYKSSL